MSVKKSIFKKIARILMKLRISAFFRIRHGGCVLKFYPSSVSRVLWVGQYVSEPGYAEQTEFLCRYLRPGDVVVDAGANIGYLTLLSSSLVGNDGIVYAIEPHPRIYRYLQGNIAFNKMQNVRTINTALGNSNGFTRFSNGKSDDMNSIVVGDTDDSGITVSVKRLDDVGIEAGCISLLKVDVEGYEKFVMEGAANMLKKVQCVYFESIESNFAKFGYGLDDLLNIFVAHEFVILEIHNGTVRDISSGHSACPACEDLVAVRETETFLKRTNYQFC